MTTTKISASGLAEQQHSLADELTQAFRRVLDSGWYVLGPEVEAFEHEFAAWTGTTHGVGLNSGTDALELSLRAHGIGPGDEVIIPSNALPTAYGVAATGATVVFADVRELDYNLDPADVAALITPRTRAIVAVHLYGHPAGIAELKDVIDGRDIVLVEDCAQSHGAATPEGRVGSLADVAAFSFYPTKNLGALGDGGMVLTNDENIAAKVRSLRMYGEERRYYSTSFGVNSRLDELQAALLRTKLPHLDGFLERRRAIAAAYDAAFADSPVVVPPCREGHVHARHLYPVRVQDRDRVLAALQAEGIPAGIHYPVGAHDQPCFAQLRSRELPVTSMLAGELLSLPIYPELADSDVTAIAARLLSASGV
jgi:dTDP-3-amino-3,4,6-trideoxy-alpha-D-glucose transaminase